MVEPVRGGLIRDRLMGRSNVDYERGVSCQYNSYTFIVTRVDLRIPYVAEHCKNVWELEHGKDQRPRGTSRKIAHLQANSPTSRWKNLAGSF